MTDGIIQKVFKEYEQDEYYIWEQFKQNIIAEIEKNLEYHKNHSNNTLPEIIKQELIGNGASPKEITSSYDAPHKRRPNNDGEKKE